MSLTIRRADVEDCATVLDFIRKLAIYENLLSEVSATDADIEQSLFGPQPRVFCDLAERNGRPAGFALWFYNYSTFIGRHGIYLEDLYVDEAFRSHGIGKALLRHLAQRCVSEGLGRLEWSVLDWNEPAIDFYEKRGALLRKEWIGCRLSGDPLAKLAEGRD